MMICSVLTKEAMIHGMQWMFSTRGDNASEKKIKISESSAVHRKDQRAKRQSHRGSFVKISSSPCDFNTSCQAQHLQKNTKKPKITEMPPYFRKLALNHTYFLTHISKADAVTEKNILTQLFS